MLTLYRYVKSKIEEEWDKKIRPYHIERNPVLNEHEATQFICIYDQRDKKKKMGYPDDIWFLSYETVLENVYRIQPQKWKKPPTFRFAAWASFIDSYLMFPHEESDRINVLKAIVRSVSSVYEIPDPLTIAKQKAFGNRLINTTELEAVKLALTDGTLITRFEKAQKGLMRKRKDTSWAEEFEETTKELAEEVQKELSEKIDLLKEKVSKLQEESGKKDKIIEKFVSEKEKKKTQLKHKKR